MHITPILLIALVAAGLLICSHSPADSRIKNVGEDFGKSWLAQNTNKFAAVASSSNGSKDLWAWGGKPLGYEVIKGEIYPRIAPTELYYPMFMSNSTPILINGTRLQQNSNYIPAEFALNGFVNDPWYLAQLTERPVIVAYPAPGRASTLL